MKLFKRKKLPDKTIIYNPGEKKSQTGRRRKISILISKVNKARLIGLTFFILIILLIFLTVKISNSPYFAISKFIFIGNRSVDDNELTESLSKFKDKNIFLTNNDEIKNYLLDNYIFFKEIKVRKVWPDQINILINEREPQLVLININGAYLCDEDGRIVGVLAQQIINFNQEELDILKGLGNPNSKYIENRLFQNWKQENNIQEEELGSTEQNFDFEAIKIEDKISELKKIQNELQLKVNENFNLLSQKVSETKYASLSRVYVYNNVIYELYGNIDHNMELLSVEVNKFFIEREEIIQKIIWEGDFSISVYLNNNKQITFSIKRNISEQFEDFKLVVLQLELNGEDYSKIDLSSKKVSVIKKL